VGAPRIHGELLKLGFSSSMPFTPQKRAAWASGFRSVAQSSMLMHDHLLQLDAILARLIARAPG
jgi:hypothetical protein